MESFNCRDIVSQLRKSVATAAQMTKNSHKKFFTERISVVCGIIYHIEIFSVG